MTDKFLSKSWFKSNLLTLIYALLIALLIRTFLFQPFFIPSSSMEPNLLIGDRLFASKYDYGYSKHVIIFKPPHTNLDYIKRLVGMPGDIIKVKDGKLIINGESAKYKELREDTKILKNGRVVKARVLIETLPNGKSYEIYNYIDGSPGDNTNEIIVPNDSYFFLGDNRDNSNDSRFWGSVNFDRLVGKAQIIFFSTEGGSKFYEIWKWPFDIQFKRLLKLIS